MLKALISPYRIQSSHIASRLILSLPAECLRIGTQHIMEYDCTLSSWPVISKHIQSNHTAPDPIWPSRIIWKFMTATLSSCHAGSNRITSHPTETHRITSHRVEEWIINANALILAQHVVSHHGRSCRILSYRTESHPITSHELVMNATLLSQFIQSCHFAIHRTVSRPIPSVQV